MAYIQEIEDVDPGSFNFRYPTRRKSEEASLPGNFSFNLSVFVQKMDLILQSLEGAESEIGEITQEEFRQAYEAHVFLGEIPPDC